MTAGSRARRRREIAPWAGPRLQPAEERDPLTVPDRARGDRGGKLWLGDRPGDLTETSHRHAALRRDLRERCPLEPPFELLRGDAERTGHPRVEGAAHAPHPD
jgi:hypothetical protein